MKDLVRNDVKSYLHAARTLGNQGFLKDEDWMSHDPEVVLRVIQPLLEQVLPLGGAWSLLESFAREDARDILGERLFLWTARADVSTEPVDYWERQFDELTATEDEEWKHYQNHQRHFAEWKDRIERKAEQYSGVSVNFDSSGSVNVHGYGNGVRWTEKYARRIGAVASPREPGCRTDKTSFMDEKRAEFSGQLIGELAEASTKARRIASELVVSPEAAKRILEARSCLQAAEEKTLSESHEKYDADLIKIHAKRDAAVAAAEDVAREKQSDLERSEAQRILTTLAAVEVRLREREEGHVREVRELRAAHESILDEFDVESAQLLERRRADFHEEHCALRRALSVLRPGCEPPSGSKDVEAEVSALSQSRRIMRSRLLEGQAGELRELEAREVTTDVRGREFQRAEALVQSDIESERCRLKAILCEELALLRQEYARLEADLIGQFESEKSAVREWHRKQREGLLPDCITSVAERVSWLTVAEKQGERGI